MTIRSWFDNPVFQRFAWVQFKRGRSPMAMLWPAAFTALLFGLPLTVPDAWFGLSSGDFALRAQWSFGLLLAYIGICTLLSAPSAVSMAAANDRAAGLLHAIRLTPQSASTKVLGYCIGPALRPYSTALLAVPFLLFAALLGATTLFGFVQIFVVIVTTSLLANLFALHIALAAKMPEPGEAPAGAIAGALGIMRRQVRPQDVGIQGAMAPFGWCIMAMMAWQAGHPAVGAVTPIPTLAGCFFARGLPAARWSEISLFGFHAPTSALTVLVQSTLAFFFFRAATRVIQDEGARGLTRREVFLMFALLAGLEVATLWEPIATSVGGTFGWGRGGPGASTLLYGYLCVMGVLAAFCLRAVSTNPGSLRRAWRRARARRQEDIELFGEGKPSLPSLLVLGWISVSGYATLLLGARAAGDQIAGVAQAVAAPLLFFLMLLVLGGVSQLSQLKPAAGGWATGAMFVLWAVIPFAGLCIQVALYEGPVSDDLLSLFPLTGLSKCVDWAFDLPAGSPSLTPAVTWGLFPGPLIPIGANFALAAIVSWAAMRLWARRSEEARLPPADPKPPAASVPLSVPLATAPPAG